LAAGQIATAVANARAYEVEKRRAEALAEIDRAKTAFFSNVSHEFRTPLTLMLGPLEDALERGDGASAVDHEQLALIHRNGLRLLKLVNTLLDFSRIEAGRFEASYEPVDLPAYTAELASVFRSAIEKAGMRLIVNCPPLVDPVYVDREMWEKIVLNLLSNAFKFTLKGEVEVALEDADARVELRVRDTGVGIPRSELPHLFERFHRAKGTRGRTYEGTGIGLALVQELAKLHGGQVGVESVYGKGSTFTVSLPKGSAHLPQDCLERSRTLASTALGAMPYVEEALRWLPADSSTPDPGTVPSDFTVNAQGAKHRTDGAHVLLADDNADMRDYIKRLLGSRYKVEAVADGQSALNAARERTPDLVLSDVMMPTLDGFSLLRALRSDPNLKAVPVILLSARTGEESRVEGLEAGADDYLTKPFSARELLARVRSQLEMAQLRRLGEERVIGILETLTEGFQAIDADWRYTYVNPALKRMWEEQGLHGDVIGKHVFDEAFPEARDTDFGRALVRAMTERVVVEVEAFYPPFQRWHSARYFPASDGGASVFIQDITARKQAEQALRQATAFREGVLNSTGEGLYSLDTQGLVTFINPAAEKLFGWTLAELRGRKMHDVTHYKHRDGTPFPAEDCPGLEVLRKGKTLTGHEDVFVRRDGTFFDVVYSSSPIREDGVITGLVVAFSDITDQIFARQERERLLAAERLAREAADAASRAKDEFLATVSHELRSPLNAMLGWARLLSGGRLNRETTARGLKSIEQNAKAQAQLVEDLLDVSRIISGKFRLNNEPVRVVRVIEAAIDSVRPAAEGKGVRLQVTLDPDAGPVSGDAGRLQQVVWNLLSNAIKFTPHNGRVQVRLMRINSHIEIVVSDTGQGIDPAFLPYVFDRFRQADGSSTRSHGGLGLGLAIVRHITELHGGSVAADSLGKGQGSTFTVRLPLMVIHTRQSNEERVHPRVDGERALHFNPSFSLEGVRVLVVDDEPETLLLLSTVLTQCRAYVKTAPSAEEGFKEVQAWRPNAIVSDIGMPGEDGYAFMKRVKTWAREAGTWIPAVALTAYARAEDRMKALASGYQMHLPKPVEPAELIAVLVSLVERPRTPGALRLEK
jgi:PAS domain S-box-containing protein